MKKHSFFYAACGLLLVLSVVLYSLLKEEKPQYVTLAIPMPQHLEASAGGYAASEEFSTYVLHPSGRRYFAYRMYVPVYLGEQGFETQNDVENYYDQWLKKLGWEETGANMCDYDMREFQPAKSYRAYFNPAVNHGRAIACLVSWFEFGDGHYLNVLIKTINPSRNVPRD